MQHAEAAAYYHYYTGLEATRKKAFAAFRQAYPGFPSIFSNCLIYGCPTGQHISKAGEANILIQSLNLPLLAKASAIGQNTFTVHFALHNADDWGG